MTERKPQVIEAIGFDVPPQILNEDMMTEEEAAAAHQKVTDWYAALEAEKAKNAG